METQPPVIPEMRAETPIWRQPSAVQLLIGAVVILALLAALFYWYSSRPQAFPAELKNAFFLTPGPHSSAYSEDTGGLTRVGPVDSTVLEATHGVTKTVFLTVNKQDTYSVTVDGKEVFATTTPLQYLSLSPDQTKVAFSLQANAAHATSTEWHVAILPLATEKMQDTGAGFSPVFLGDAHFMYFVPYGIRMHDLGNGSDYAALLFPFKDASLHTLASPNRKKMGWLIGNGPVGLFDITHVAPVALHYEGIGSTTPNAVYTLGDGALYEVRQHNGVSEVWKRTAVNQKPVRIYVFPKGITIDRITF